MNMWFYWSFYKGKFMITFSKKKIALALSAATLASSAMAAYYFTATPYDRTSNNMQEGSVKFKAFNNTYGRTMNGAATINAYAGSSSNYAKPFTICYRLWLRNTNTGKDVNQGSSFCFNSKLVNGKHVIEDTIYNSHYSTALSNDDYRFLLAATSYTSPTASFETRKYGEIKVYSY